ncbi:MAG TPA: GNAT family N-acetyltransferase [Ornithinicoccus sp.]|jgi:predicted GNAT family acetyltransferase|nr:GNAT family N-acetyltransferase [Ornithinicoccus sp.]
MSDPEVTVEQNTERHRFEALVEGKVAGFITYRSTDDEVELQHTVVKPDYEGRGVGSLLVRTTLEQIQEAGKKVIPSCPFVRAYLDRHPEWDSLRAS